VTAATTTTAAPVTKAATSIPSLGVKKGIVTLTGPATAAKGSLVVFILDGPKRVLRTDARAPFAVKVNTRALPNGTYTVTTLVVRKGTRSVAATSSLQIKNTAPRPTTKPRPSTSTPTRTAANSGGGDSTQPPQPPSSSGTGFAAQVLSLANTERAKAGCGPLKLNSKLNSAAQAHSTDMATHNYFSHDSRDGSSPFDRIKAAGYSFTAAAENIAAGSTTAAGVMDQWMNSAGHKANILNCTYVDLGVGFANGVNADYPTYWTQDFAKPA
jgi:uncharacterized protein YkwD